jgi:hypothetical protein
MHRFLTRPSTAIEPAARTHHLNFSGLSCVTFFFNVGRQLPDAVGASHLAADAVAAR